MKRCIVCGGEFPEDELIEGMCHEHYYLDDEPDYDFIYGEGLEQDEEPEDYDYDRDYD